MPRPVRIEYDNALDHVMNRGRGRQWIFHSDTYSHTFLDTLADARTLWVGDSWVLLDGYSVPSDLEALLQEIEALKVLVAGLHDKDTQLLKKIKGLKKTLGNHQHSYLTGKGKRYNKVTIHTGTGLSPKLWTHLKSTKCARRCAIPQPGYTRQFKGKAPPPQR